MSPEKIARLRGYVSLAERTRVERLAHIDELRPDDSEGAEP